MLTKILRLPFILLLAFVVCLTACQPKEKKNTIKIGTIAGPETELMEVAQKVAVTQGLTIEIVTFADYIEPNVALADGSIDANMFQHQPYLDQQIKDHGYPIMALSKTFIYPMGIYSQKIKNLKQIKENSVIAIPNDPSNEGRALLLAQAAQLITLRKNVGLYATPVDIQKNNKHLQFKELDAAQLTRVLPDVSAAFINTNYAMPAGLFPTKDAIFHEKNKSPYANILVIRIADKENANLKKLKEVLHSAEVLQAAKKIFKEQAIPAD